MNGIAAELEQKLKSLSPAKAASVEKLVRDALELAGAGEHEPAAGTTREEAVAAHREHIRRSLAAAAELDWSDFERPPQGELEEREEW